MQLKIIKIKKINKLNSKKIILLLFIILTSSFVFSQNKNQEIENKNFFGFNVGILVPNNLILQKSINEVYKNDKYILTNKYGYLYGISVKHDFTKHYSLQTGINYIHRNFSAEIINSDTSIQNNLRFISYELPIYGLIYVRLFKNIYMDISPGFSTNFFPSDIISNNMYGKRYRFVTFSGMLNIGWEFRTKNSGYFYLGASYKRDASNMIYVAYFKGIINGLSDYSIAMHGDYLNINFTYYLPQNKK